MMLYRRAWRLIIGTIEIDGTNSQDNVLDISFVVEKDDKTTPNTAAITVHNLSPNHRRSIEDASVTSVTLHAGYRDSMQAIFSGDIVRAKNRKSQKSSIKSRRESIGYVTEIEASDAGSAYRDTRVNRSYPPGSSVMTIAQDLVRDLAIGEGNLRDFSGYFSVPGLGATLTDGTVVSGLAHRELDRIVRSCGMTYSIQDGNIRISRRGQPTPEIAVMLTSDSGLIGSPQKEAGGKYVLKTLLIPSIYPGRKLVVESRDVSGQLVCNKVSYTGDTSGNDWYCDIEASEY